MSRQVLAELREALSTGVFRDPSNDMVPMWSDGRNIVFDEAGPRPVDAFSPVIDALDTRPIRGVTQALIGQERLVFFGDQVNLYRYSVDDHTLINVSKSQNAYNGSFWQFGKWGNWMIAVNDVDPIQILKGNRFEDMETNLNQTVRARSVRTYKQHAVFFGVDGEKREIFWSDEDDVENLSPTIANAAGDLFIRDIESEIEAAASHPGGIVFYGKKSAHLLQWLDAPWYFGAIPLAKNVGVFGPNSVVNVGGMHFGMGSDGMWMMAPGEAPQYIDSPAIHRTVYDDLDFDNAHKCTVWVDINQKVVIFSYPSKTDGNGEPTRSAMLTLSTRTWCPLDFAATGASDTPALEHASAADFRGQLYWHGIPGAELPTAFSTLGHIPMTDNFTAKNYYGLGGYGEFGYGGPPD